LAVFVRSPAAYEALKDFNIIQLPSRATLQAYTGTFHHEADASSKSTASQVTRYRAFQESCKAENKEVPKADGALIFDEVKVIFPYVEFTKPPDHWIGYVFRRSVNIA